MEENKEEDIEYYIDDIIIYCTYTSENEIIEKYKYLLTPEQLNELENGRKE